MKRLSVYVLLLALAYACGNAPDASTDAGSESATGEVSRADDDKGVGPVTSVVLNNPLDQSLVDKGKDIYELKCAACHKLTDMRVVGPGFKGVTERRKPEWIMNMILNTDAMLTEDATAQALLEQCLTRMPNQNLTEADARAVLEFLYANDME